MKLMVGLLWVHCCLESCCLGLADACSFFPSHICCSSTTFTKVINQTYVADFESTMSETREMNATLPKKLRILCFGDSLTAGYTRSGYEHHPYADHLRAELEHMLLSSNIEIEVDGFSGDQVQGLYLNRIKRKCPVDKGRLYDWIVIMGGTNDLGWGHRPEEIFEGLSKSFTLGNFNDILGRPL